MATSCQIQKLFSLLTAAHSMEVRVMLLLLLLCLFVCLKEVDWEVELAFVIGRRGKHIKVSLTTLTCDVYNNTEASVLTFISTPLVLQEEDALSYVAGFTVANDVSARDWQMKRNGKQWLLGKTFDSFCPLGPALVTTDAVRGENERKRQGGRDREQKLKAVC